MSHFSSDPGVRVEHDGTVTGPGPVGLVLTPGASAGRDQSSLVAIDQEVSRLGIAVERVEFPGRTAGKRRPDRPEVCIETVRSATVELAARLHVPTRRVAIGGRSMGGRMCSLAAVEGLEVAALVLVSYPLHPPGRPDRLRTAHFPDLRVPCLFVSGTRDAFGSPAEFERRPQRFPEQSRVFSSMGTMHCASGTPRSPTSCLPGWPSRPEAQRRSELSGFAEGDVRAGAECEPFR